MADGAKLVCRFDGFVATTFDAALLVEAAIAGILPTVPVQNGRINGASVAQSGAVYVSRKLTGERWKDCLSWTERRAGYHGFDFYREATKNQAEARTAADIAYENSQRDRLNPYLGSYAADKRVVKRGGLVKKSLSFRIGGVVWAVHAYYDMATIAAGNLLRPRSSEYAGQLLGLAPRQEFWDQRRSTRMADDGNVGTVLDWAQWSRQAALLAPPAGPVPAALPASVAPAVPAVPAVPAGLPLAALPAFPPPVAAVLAAPLPAPPAPAVPAPARPNRKRARQDSVSSAAAPGPAAPGSGQPPAKRARLAPPPPALAAGPVAPGVVAAPVVGLPAAGAVFSPVPPPPAPVPASIPSPLAVPAAPVDSGFSEEEEAAFMANLDPALLLPLSLPEQQPFVPVLPAEGAFAAAAMAAPAPVPVPAPAPAPAQQRNNGAAAAAFAEWSDRALNEDYSAPRGAAADAAMAAPAPAPAAPAPAQHVVDNNANIDNDAAALAEFFDFDLYPN